MSDVREPLDPLLAAAKIVDDVLLDSRDALRLALSAGRLGTWRWDMATGAIRWDQQLEMIFGLPPGGFDGTFETYQSLLHPDDRAHVLEVVHAALAAKSDYDVEHRCVWPDGTVHWLQGRGSVTLGGNGEVTGTVGCVGDITERVVRRGQAADLSASLQAGLLPHLASPPGLTVQSRYRPGEERLLLGGDFLDVAVTPSGDTAFCIGDVSGRGAGAAAVGTSLRAGWRALALTGDDPAAWVAGCADVLAAGDPSPELFVTMTTGLVSADRQRLVLLSAGHPPPVLVAEGTARSLVVDACPPLGLLSKDGISRPVSFPLPPGWALLMFTDGLFEGRAEPGGVSRLGLDEVVRWCRRLEAGNLDDDCLDALIAHVEQANGGPIVDDIAVLLLASEAGGPA
jgi:PAS domain S-box-containing protein